ncbi:MAG: CopG family transcriptional regulator [Acidobacteria bacterium]|nr:CopG family transcriptional regulator [Acidobacteriota bacterium]
MRTTLTIDDDVLAAAKDLASHQHKSIGEVISALSRQALQPEQPGRRSRNGVPLLVHTGDTTPVSLELVNQLRDEFPG